MSEWLWEVANSPAFISAVVGFVVYLLNRLYAKKPTWKKFEGHIISAIKFAEKSIPDGSDNKSARRADEALKYVIAVFEKVNKREPTTAEKHELEEGIRITHNEVS